MDLKFKITGYIARPVHDVFEAVADPDILSRYFTTGGAKGASKRARPSPGTFTTFRAPFRLRWPR